MPSRLESATLSRVPDTAKADSQHQAAPLVVVNLNKRYDGGIWANRDISLTAERGEILGILGPNGAGKTTMVRQITTELRPTSGEIRVFGHDVVSEPARAKSLLGIVPQEASLFEYLTVRDHLRMFGMYRGLSRGRSRKRADELIEELHLDSHRDVLCGNLSGGLRRRVMIGIAALASPPMMVLDEPTTGLDPQSRRDLWALLRRHKERGATVIITTHYMEEAEALSDRVGIIHKGRLLALDTGDALRAAHGFELKLTYTVNDSAADTRTMYGTDSGALVDRARAEGVEHFSVEPTNLEDIYLALTGEEEGLDGKTG